ncbi:hypothetical protein BH11MYX1_BH11MYX1_34630 [soil metagenome]
MPGRVLRPTPVIAALLIGALIIQIEINVVGTAMPDISAELKDFSLYPWVFAGYLVAYTAFVPLSGMLNDTFGRRPTYLLSMALIAAGTMFCGMATSMQMLVAGRLIQGCGAGSIFVTTQTILGDLFTTEKRARVQSAVSLVGGLGATTGPALGGWFVTYATWRWAFFVTLPVVIVTCTLFLIGFVDSTKRGTRAVNWRGALLLTLILVGLLVGIGKGDLNPWLLAGAGALTIPFLLLERRAERPVLPPDLFLNPAFRISALTLFLLGAMQASYIVFLPIYLQGVVGLAPSTSGYLQAVPLTVAATASTFVVGTFIKRRGYRLTVRVGALCALLLTLASAAAAWQYDRGNSTTAVMLLIVQQMLLGGCWGFAMTGAIICVQNQVPQARRGTATASVHLIRGIGSVLASALLGYLLLGAMRDQHLAIAPEKFFDQKALPKLLGLDASGVASARAGLGVALHSLIPILVGIGALAFVSSLFFPKAVVDVDAKT